MVAIKSTPNRSNTILSLIANISDASVVCPRLSTSFPQYTVFIFFGLLLGTAEVNQTITAINQVFTITGESEIIPLDG